MVVEDGGAVYTGQALRMKYRNLVEVGLQGRDGGGVVVGGSTDFGGGFAREDGDGEAYAEGLDEWDRELMGDEDEDEGEGGDLAEDEDEGPTSVINRMRTRQGRRVVAELPRYDDALEGEYDEDDDDFMDGELVGGGEDFSE